MTIDQMRSQTIKNYETAIEIGKQKVREGLDKEVAKMRLRTFKDLQDWLHRGCSKRRKDEMDYLLGRSQHMINVFNRL